MQKILIIEDNEEVRENTAEILGLSDYSVLIAEDGQSGADLALKEHPDLIICDIMMPRLDGYGVLQLLGQHPDTASIPFIFLTAKSEKSDFRKGMEMGADDYLTKPFDGKELLNAIHVRLKKSAVLKESFGAGLKGVNEFIDRARESGLLTLTSGEREVGDFRKKTILYTEGQRPRAVYYIVAGKLKTFKTNADGKELITNLHGPGDFVGYIPILEDLNYKDSAQVLEDAQIMLIPREDFQELITRDMRIARQFIKLISKEILDKEETLLNLAYNSLRKKVAFGIVQLMEKFVSTPGAGTTLYISRENLAHVTGVATESLIRTLADFKSENLIDIEYGKIIVLQEKRLRELPN